MKRQGKADGCLQHLKKRCIKVAILNGTVKEVNPFF
jgi:hypothetical protein